MNIISRSAACLLVSTTLVLSGCANTGSSLLAGTKPDARLTSGEQSKFFSASGAQGCGLGALAGAGLGALAGSLKGNSKDALIGAAIGGAAGCAVGMTANYYLDSLQKDYATTGDRLKAMDTDISKDTSAVEKTTLTMKQVISENQATLAKISQQKNKAGFDKANATKELSQIDANIKLMKDKIKVMKDKDAAYKVALKAQETNNKADKAKLEVLNKEYAKLNSQITALEAEANGLFEQRQAISLG
ncbi:glycine zipper 2TM domain-containing protein [Symbiopectobacterium purcellii]|uniref:Glycine zipper 2TM domain-containing protein n=1 Tax=Symbiopectobacterium purcellii TaxID=2871826 RepID=A0ABX9AMR8_9ENTR|nr:glycine zipper 2TM domain-containing protein [Symbiopectobacterium purcellii]QZN96472.1 glycine zipper 2TM domain-containing protein [Symbiopectobacterium purcellii]